MCYNQNERNSDCICEMKMETEREKLSKKNGYCNRQVESIDSDYLRRVYPEHVVSISEQLVAFNVTFCLVVRARSFVIFPPFLFYF